MWGQPDGKGSGKWMEVGKCGLENGDGKRLWGNGHMMQCEDDVLLSVTLEICIDCKSMSPSVN